MNGFNATSSVPLVEVFIETRAGRAKEICMEVVDTSRLSNTSLGISPVSEAFSAPLISDSASRLKISEQANVVISTLQTTCRLPSSKIWTRGILASKSHHLSFHKSKKQLSPILAISKALEAFLGAGVTLAVSMRLCPTSFVSRA
jgi:hypothetical protein